MKKTIFSLVFISFLFVGLATSTEAIKAFEKPAFGQEIPSLPSNYTYIITKSKEEIALELFFNARKNLGELKVLTRYDEYLNAYRKALEAVYSITPEPEGNEQK